MMTAQRNPSSCDLLACMRSSCLDQELCPPYPSEVPRAHAHIRLITPQNTRNTCIKIFENLAFMPFIVNFQLSTIVVTIASPFRSSPELTGNLTVW